MLRMQSELNTRHLVQLERRSNPLRIQQV